MTYGPLTGHVQATRHTGGKREWQRTEDLCLAAIWDDVATKMKKDPDTAYYTAGPHNEQVRSTGFRRYAQNPPEKHLTHQQEHFDKDALGRKKHWQGTRAYSYVVQVTQS
ncbi:unnamed protein product [Absidia cylindrospora]